MQPTTRFKQICAVTMADQVTGGEIPIIFALAESGMVWQKVGRRGWEVVVEGLDNIIPNPTTLSGHPRIMPADE